MKIIALCGMPGSGKGEAAEIALSKNIPVFSMGDIVRRSFRETFPDRDPVETGIYANEERDLHGKDIWARRLMSKIDRAARGQNGLFIIDGLRSRYEADLFRQHWNKDLLIMAVHTSPELRFNRLKERGRGDDSSSRTVFDERDQRELGWGLGEVIALADIVVINEGDLETFRKNMVREFDR